MNKKDSIEILRERIRLLENENRVTGKAFAEQCDISPNTLSNLMTRGKAIQYDLLEKIAGAYDVSIDWLVGRTETREVANEGMDEDMQAHHHPDYSSLNYGHIFNILAFLASLNYLQIVQKDNEVILKVQDKYLAKFLRTLQKLARMSRSDQSVCDAFKVWVERSFADNTPIEVNVPTGVDRYHGAFPWEHDATVFLNFDFSDAEWLDDYPDKWDDGFTYEDLDGVLRAENSRPPYNDYKILNDGIVGYYYSGNDHTAPQICSVQREQEPADNPVTNP